MSLDEWGHVSKIVYAYDRYNTDDRLTEFLNQQYSLPLKLRSKKSLAINFMCLSMQTVIHFLRQSIDFQSLSIDARRALIRQNLYFTSYFHGIFLGQTHGLWKDEDFQMSMGNLYGSKFVSQCTRLSDQMDSNGMLIKIAIILLIFSSNYSIVSRNPSSDSLESLNSTHLLSLQDFYAKLLWKYLVYQYGHTEAVLRYASLIKITLDIFDLVADWVDREDFQDMVNKILCQTEYGLILCSDRICKN